MKEMIQKGENQTWIKQTQIQWTWHKSIQECTFGIGSLSLFSPHPFEGYLAWTVQKSFERHIHQAPFFLFSYPTLCGMWGMERKRTSRRIDERRTCTMFPRLYHCLLWKFILWPTFGSFSELSLILVWLFSLVTQYGKNRHLGSLIFDWGDYS